jgi:hypothetical protein
MIARPFRDKLNDLTARPEDWHPVGVHVERSSRKGGRAKGVSAQIILQNGKTGETIVRHVVTDDRGRVIQDHYRDDYQPREGDRDANEDAGEN